MSLETSVNLLPKVELRLHLEAAVAAITFRDSAVQNGIGLPGGKAAAALSIYASLADFLKIYGLAGASIRTAADFGARALREIDLLIDPGLLGRPETTHSLRKGPSNDD